MAETRYKNVYEMFINVRSQALAYESEIICYDDPKNLTMGWYCEKSEHASYIRSIDAKQPYAFADLPDFEGLASDNNKKILLEAFRTIAGRKQLAQLLSYSSPPTALDKYTGTLVRKYKLTAFW